MKIHQFQVSSGHIKLPNKLRVIIYDDLDDVRRIGGRWAGGAAYGNDTYGVTNKQLVYDEKNEHPARVEAIIRLEKDHCPTGIVAHEVCHAAVYFFTQDGHRLYRNSPISKEEKFCYLYGDLFHEVTKKMHKIGVWS